jgi:uncharacterized protein with beta-barrel porin domain
LTFVGVGAASTALAVPIDVAITFATTSNTPESSVSEAMQAFCGPLNALSPKTPEQQQLADVCLAALNADAFDSADVFTALSARAATAETTLAARGPDALFFAGFEKRLSALRKIASLKTSVAPMDYFFDGERIPMPWITAATDTPVSDAPDGLLSNRWGGFFDFGANRAEQDETSTQAGLKTTLNGLTGGVDYRLRNDTFLGAAVRYQVNDGDIEGGLGSVEGSDVTLTLFGTYYPTQDFYLEGTLLWNTGNYELTREIAFDIAGVNYAATASSDTDTQRTALSVDAGYALNLGANTVLFTTSLLYGRSTIDGFTEKGAGGFNLAVKKQTIDYSTFTLGAQFTRTISTGWAVIIPEVGLTSVVELKNDGQKITSSFVADPNTTEFSFTTDERDDNYLRAALGSTFVFTRGRSAFVRYEQVLAYENLKLNSLTLGARLEF